MEYKTFDVCEENGLLSYHANRLDAAEKEKSRPQTLRFLLTTAALVVFMLVTIGAALNSQDSSTMGLLGSITSLKESGKNEIDSKQNQVEQKDVEVKILDTSIISGLGAPVVFQSIDNYNFMYKFTQKYGLDGDGFEESKSVFDFAGGKGWVYVTMYPHGNCEGVEYSVGGIMTGTCFSIDSESKTDDYNSGNSVMFGCDGGNAMVNRYEGSGCKIFKKAVNLTSNTCGSLSSTSWNDVDTNLAYGVIKCSQANDLPITGDYAVMRAFLDKTPTSFEALKMDSCIDLDWNSESQSALVKVSDNEPYLEYYDGSSNCGGDPDTTYDLSSDEEELETEERGDSTVSYKWEYYSTTASPTETTTASPSEAPILAAPVEIDSTSAPTILAAPGSISPVLDEQVSVPSIAPTENLKTYHPSLPADLPAVDVVTPTAVVVETVVTSAPTEEAPTVQSSSVPTENSKTYHPSLPLDLAPTVPTGQTPTVLQNVETEPTAAANPTSVESVSSSLPTENSKTYHPSLPPATN